MCALSSLIIIRLLYIYRLDSCRAGGQIKLVGHVIYICSVLSNVKPGGPEEHSATRRFPSRVCSTNRMQRRFFTLICVASGRTACNGKQQTREYVTTIFAVPPPLDQATSPASSRLTYGRVPSKCCIS